MNQQYQKSSNDKFSSVLFFLPGSRIMMFQAEYLYTVEIRCNWKPSSFLTSCAPERISWSKGFIFERRWTVAKPLARNNAPRNSRNLGSTKRRLSLLGGNFICIGMGASLKGIINSAYDGQTWRPKQVFMLSWGERTVLIFAHGTNYQIKGLWMWRQPKKTYIKACQQA